MFEQKSEQLAQDRKATKTPVSYKKKSEFKAFTPSKSQMTSAAIVGVDLAEDRLLVSLADGTQNIMEYSTNKLIHTVKANGLAKLIPASKTFFVDGSNAGVYDYQTGTQIYKISNHKRVTCFSFHPMQRFLVVGSDDRSWSLHDLQQGLLIQVQVDQPVTSIQYHPDGLVLAVGLQNGCIRLYDIRT